MSSLSLILGEAQFRTTIAELKIDAALSIQHNATATPSKNPIEARSGDPIDNFTDHVRLENRTVSIEGLVSESPLSVLGSAFNIFTGAASGLAGSQLSGQLGGFATQALAAGLGSIAGMIASRNEGDLQYPQRAFDYLQELRDNRIPFSILTRLRKYENMIITSISVPQSAPDGGSLRFTAQLEQIEIVQTKVVLLPEASTKNPSAASKQNLGKQAKEAANADNSSKAKSFFDNLGITTRGSGV